MKSLNIMQFVSDVSETLTEYRLKIDKASTLDEAKKPARLALGYIDCMITLSNCMICSENNEITPLLDEVEQSWTRKIWQALINVADRTGEGSDTIMKLCQKRDEYI